jgi:SAM-dependent methyltransferase
MVRSPPMHNRWKRAKLHEMSSANATEIEHWNGDEARHWVEEQDRYDRQLASFADALLRAAAIGPSDRVLDLGCGCGTTTLLAARDGGEAVGVDISAPMLENARARARVAKVTNVQFEQADVQTHAFEPASFDVAISRFGVMFFDDPVAAFTNVAGALRPDGRLAFVCWQDLGRNEWLLAPGMAAAQYVPLPDMGEPGGPGMFSLAEPARVHALLDAAGFGDVDLAVFEAPILLAGGGTVDETIEFLAATGIAHAMFDQAEPDAAARAMDAVREVLAAHHDDEGVRLGASAWVVTARRG